MWFALEPLQAQPEGLTDRRTVSALPIGTSFFAYLPIVPVPPTQVPAQHSRRCAKVLPTGELLGHLHLSPSQGASLRASMLGDIEQLT